MLSEPWEKGFGPVWDYGTPLAHRHGTGKFRKGIPGFPEMANGATVGIQVSAAFFDGHVEGVDQDFAYDPIHEFREIR
jgi:prepilin-type processing-associated H-X9-DG protein